MRIRIDDWEFAVDITATMQYSAQEAAEHCACAYCRNFYGSVDDAYPQLRPFLAQFGVDITAPDELCPFEPPTEMVGCYAVSGEILKKGKHPLFAGGLAVMPKSAEEITVNTFLAGQCFFLETDRMILPWVLDEPMDAVRSPANQPDFLQKTVKRLLGLFQKDPFQS